MLNLTQYFPITDPTLVFLVVLIIILLAPIIMGKLRIPHIIGMVLAGIAVGQYGFNILERDNSFELFGKVGLYYIMFLAALEMDTEGKKPLTVWRLWRAHMLCAPVAHLRYNLWGAALFARGINVAGLHHGLKHAYRLPYREPIWPATQAQRSTERRLVDVVVAHGAGHAGGLGGG